MRLIHLGGINVVINILIDGTIIDDMKKIKVPLNDDTVTAYELITGVKL